MAKTNLIAAIALKLSGANLFSYLSANHSKGNEKNETNQRGDSQQREEPQLIHAAITLTRKNPGNEKKMKNRLISHSAFSLLCLAI